MKVFEIKYSGSACVEADSEEEAKEKYFKDEFGIKEEQLLSIKEYDDCI